MTNVIIIDNVSSLCELYKDDDEPLNLELVIAFRVESLMFGYCGKSDTISASMLRLHHFGNLVKHVEYRTFESIHVHLNNEIRIRANNMFSKFTICIQKLVFGIGQ